MDPAGWEGGGGVGGESEAHADSGRRRGGAEVPALVEAVPHDGHDGGRSGDHGQDEGGPGALPRPLIREDQEGEERPRHQEGQADGREHLPGAQQGAQERRGVDGVERVLLAAGAGRGGGPHRVLEPEGAGGTGGARAGGTGGAGPPVAGRGRSGRRAGGVFPAVGALRAVGQRGEAGGEGEDALAQLLEPGGGQVADDDPRVPAPGHLDGQPAQPEDAAQEGVDDVDGLDAGQARDAQLLVEDAGAQVHPIAVDGVGLRPPAQEQDEDDDGDEREQAQQRPHQQVVAEVEAVGDDVAVDLDEVVRVADGNDRDDRAHDLPALQERGDGVHAPPDEVGGQGDAALGAAGALGALGAAAHSPAIRCSPRSDRIWRSRSASPTGRPLMVASVVAAAVWSLTSAIPRARARGPWEVSTNCMRP